MSFTQPVIKPPSKHSINSIASYIQPLTCQLHYTASEDQLHFMQVLDIVYVQLGYITKK